MAKQEPTTNSKVTRCIMDTSHESSKSSKVQNSKILKNSKCHELSDTMARKGREE
jgi:hypothetical protein